MLDLEMLWTLASGSTITMQVKNALARAAAKAGAGLLEVLLPLLTLQQGPKAVQAAFQQALQAHPGRVKLAVIDHVASFPPVEFDVKRLCSLCKASGARGVVPKSQHGACMAGEGSFFSINVLERHNMSYLRRCACSTTMQHADVACLLEGACPMCVRGLV
jgi:hypothetical protein